jgi:hypothetical protein
MKRTKINYLQKPTGTLQTMAFKSTVKHIYRGIRRFKIKEIPFLEDFPCYKKEKCKNYNAVGNLVGKVPIY